MKCTTTFPAALIDRADYFFQPTKALFVARTYDLLENLREVLEQFHRLAAQHWVFLSRHHLASGANTKEQNAGHDGKVTNLGC